MNPLVGNGFVDVIHSDGHDLKICRTVGLGLVNVVDVCEHDSFDFS